MNQQEWLARAPWPFPPPWATAWGDDPCGLWAEFTVPASNVVQRMRWIEAGSFTMGSPPEETAMLDNRELYEDERPPHTVTIGAGYWLADTTCTQALWYALMGQNPSHFQEDKGGGPNHPVEKVNWQMVMVFLAKLNALLPAAQFTLPTEAEWEYACRAGRSTPFWFGANITPEQVNYNGNYPYASGAKGEYRGKTVPVKALPHNGWGLYQMHGNVWEWCADIKRVYTEAAVVDPGLADIAAAQVDEDVGAAHRMVRGGSWNLNAQIARSAIRGAYSPGRRDNYLGFRLACRSSGLASGV